MNRAAISKLSSLLAGILATSAGGWACIAPLRAQEIVQAPPARETGQLNAALRKLAARPADLDALLSAGEASLALHDVGAAAGFFARAARVAPGDARVQLGLARVALEQRRPVEALQGFAQAEGAGVRPFDMAADRGLAYDLVGDNASAQALYRSVLTAGDNAEVRRRLALSLAISGNLSEFERTLYPLLRDEDRAAYRTRAFGLAILGLPDAAVEIADAMMPTDLALRMAPYLRYMPRLTRSQQAAAGNLGAFPAATEIGRDPPDIAGYAEAGARIAASTNAALTPAGPPLGPRAGSAAPSATLPIRRRPGRGGETAPAPSPPAPPVRIAQAETSAPRPAPAPSPASSPALAVRVAGPPVTAPAPTQTPQPARRSLADIFADLGTAPAASTRPAAGAVDIAGLAAVRRAVPAPAPKSVEKIEARQPAAKPKTEARKPAKPAEPARVWVQVGVGRNTDAFAFDWKKLVKQADGVLDGKGPWAVSYGATNRMLAGPFPTDAAAKAAIKRLKEKDIGALPYRSDEGEKVTRIG